MSFLVANGLRFHAVRLGDEGPPVVMLHGLLVGNLAAWAFTGARALARNHRVLMYDLRGHGRSERATGGYDVPTMTDDLEAIADAEFPGEPLTLVGHSYGALISLQLAQRDPDRVERMVLVDAPVPPTSTEELTDFLSRDPAEWVEALPLQLQDSVRQRGRRANRVLSSLHFLACETTLLADLEAQRDVTDEELAAVDIPTLCVYGEESPCLEAGRRVAAAMPDARLEVLPGGHFLTMDAPGALTDAITGFVDG
ncbi:MAG: alpha/beta fold hydrolase [Myxococcota bacterium]